jgi:hypothetical protein
LRDIKVDEVRKAVLRDAAELDAAAWSQFPEDEQNAVLHRLTMVRDSLQIAMLRVGILAPSGVPGDGSSVATLNSIGIYALAAQTGLFAKTATTKLAEVFDTMFRTGEPASKDLIGPERPPGGNPSAAG